MQSSLPAASTNDPMASDADRIRIAIALCALKFKPPEQSFASYVLDLRSRFSSSTTSAELDSSWRTRALTLESDLSALREKYDAEHIKLLALTNAAEAMQKSSANANRPSSPATKKKTKKKTLASSKHPLPSQLPGVDLEAVLEGLHNHIPIIPGPDSLFSTYTAFHQLTSLPLPSPQSPEATTRPALLISTTIRTMEAIASVLLPILKPASSDYKSPEVLQSLSTLLQHLLNTILPLLASSGCTSNVAPQALLLNILTTKILHPVIHSFAPLSRAHLSALFLPDSNTSKGPPTRCPSDIRSSVLSLFRHIFCLLADSIPNGHGLSESLALETARELNNQFAFPEMENEFNKVRAVRDERVKTLAQKEALWYLCSILHLVFTPTTKVVNPRHGFSGELDQKERKILHEAIVTALSGLLRRCAGEWHNDILGDGTGVGTERDPGLSKKGRNRQGSQFLECGFLNGVGAAGFNANDRAKDGLGVVKDALKIDVVGHEMILAIVERYWLWSCES